MEMTSSLRLPDKPGERWKCCLQGMQIVSKALPAGLCISCPWPLVFVRIQRLESQQSRPLSQCLLFLSSLAGLSTLPHWILCPEQNSSWVRWFFLVLSLGNLQIKVRRRTPGSAQPLGQEQGTKDWKSPVALLSITGPS